MTEHSTLPKPIVSPDWLAQRLGDPALIVLDARRASDYETGHIDGAFSFSLSRILDDERADSVAKTFGRVGVGNGIDVVVYDDYQGTHASRLAWTVESLGHTEVALLNVGFARWSAMGLPVSVSEPRVFVRKFNVQSNPSISASVEDIQGSIGSPSVVLADARERLNYLEEHIPNAVSLPWKMFTARETIFLDPARIKGLIASRRINPEKEIITYCGSAGTLSSLVYYAFRLAGFGRVRLYARSLNEWREMKLPMEGVKEAQFWDLSVL